MSAKALPSQAQVVVLGGGIIGTSVAYFLADYGLSDVVLLEQSKLTAGTTWHAAGLMATFGSTSETSTELRKITIDMYRRLEEETGQATGFMDVGFIEVAANRDRLEEYRRVAAFNRYCGIDVEEITPKKVEELFPIAKVDDIEAGFYVKTDGRVNPVDATMAIAKGARQKGVQVFQDTLVSKVLTKRNRVHAVECSEGTIECQYVVNCLGMWARQFGEQNDLIIPNQACEHYYLITDDIPDLPKDMPVLEDPSCYGYYRNEGGGLMIGLFEPESAPWKVEGVPQDFSFADLPPDWDRMTPFLEKAMSRVPITMEAGIKKFFCGPESFTPDLSPIVGEAPEVRNYFVAAGLNSIGITTGPGIGKLLAHWIVHGRPEFDVTCMNANRFQQYQLTPTYRRERAKESLGNVYKPHYPYKPMLTARNAKLSPFHDRLKEAGAYFRDVSGWESPDWYEPDGKEPDMGELSWGRHRWFPFWEAEHKACREGVILMDMSFMSKFLVQGKDAGEYLNYISANEVNGECELITYTQWLNQDGRLEADLTVLKLTEEKFIVVATDTMHRHVESWLKRHVSASAHVTIDDITPQYGQLNIQGPRSRELLQSLTSVDLSNEAFPFRRASEIDIGLSKVLCVRITYLGELGYELYIPASQASQTYDALIEAGKSYGLKHAGLKALSSLRMEKGYRDYGHDIDNTDDPFECGLGFAVNLKTDTDFIGKAKATEKKASSPYTRRLMQVLVKDPEPLMFHAEIVLRNGTPVGYVRAASYGHTLGGAVGLAMIEAGEPVNKDYIAEGNWEVDIAGKRYPAEVSLRPMYDPKMERIKV